jgi:hypothetical protein
VEKRGLSRPTCYTGNAGVFVVPTVVACGVRALWETGLRPYAVHIVHVNWTSARRTRCGSNRTCVWVCVSERVCGWVEECTLCGHRERITRRRILHVCTTECGVTSCTLSKDLLINTNSWWAKAKKWHISVGMMDPWNSDMQQTAYFHEGVEIIPVRCSCMCQIAKRTSQLHQLYSMDKRPWVWFHGTLQSRQALYQLSYQGNSAKTIKHKT